MIKPLLITLALTGCAQAPWTRDCVTPLGRDIPLSERTPSNCPKGINHWDQGPKEGQLFSVARGPNTLPQTVLLPSGNYVIIKNATSGATQAIVPVSRK